MTDKKKTIGEIFSEAKNGIVQKGIQLIGDIKPTRKTSAFLDNGVLTPEEFVNAGDLLTYKCPSWEWKGGETKSKVPYLPDEKQFLITKLVICSNRATTYAEDSKNSDYNSVNVEGDDGWFAPEKVEKKEEEIPDIDKDDDDSDSDIPDIEEFNDDNNIVEDNSTIGKTDNIEKTRTYDISITYDNFYQTPKLWLFGYDENKQPLSGEQIFEDISEEHARKTVTITKHPHLPQSFAYIHPCKHSEVMHSLTERMLSNGKEPRVDMYLFIFLKFMSTVLPTIEYDNTMSLDFDN
eukprot:TRINITY_DN2269_c0_g1_i2.p1 TRINITY_DN2269_c0_g1~~TRINITY_DN2269_c0_g1_i2.p1  ORF type:complete len:293 (-),score=83.08 TRINITY_DN2269_c0_g1_i2:32-910(-)